MHARKILCSQNSDWHSKRPFSKDLCYRWLGAYGSNVLSLHSLWTQRKLHVTPTWCLCQRIPRNRREVRNKNRGEQRPCSGPQLEIYSDLYWNKPHKNWSCTSAHARDKPNCMCTHMRGYTVTHLHVISHKDLDRDRSWTSMFTQVIKKCSN